MMDRHTIEVISPAEVALAIQSSTADVFSTMLGMPIETGEWFTGKTAGSGDTGVVALLGLAGSCVGSGSIYCDAPFACKMASHLLLAEYDAVNDDVLDAVAEVANMIVGNVKTMLEERLGSMGLSTPTVIYGRNFETRSTHNRDWTIVPFESGGARLNVQLTIAPNMARNKHYTPGFPIAHVLGY